MEDFVPYILLIAIFIDLCLALFWSKRENTELSRKVRMFTDEVSKHVLEGEKAPVSLYDADGNEYVRHLTPYGHIYRKVTAMDNLARAMSDFVNTFTDIRG